MKTSSHEFIRRFLSDQQVQERYAGLDPDAFLATARADGFEITPEELAVVFEELLGGEVGGRDLSERDLEKVSGGFFGNLIGVLGIPAISDTVSSGLDLLGAKIKEIAKESAKNNPVASLSPSRWHRRSS